MKKTITMILLLSTFLFIGCSEDKNKQDNTNQEKFDNNSIVPDEQIQEELSPKENQINSLPNQLLEDENDIIEDDIKDINQDEESDEIQDEISSFKEYQQN